MVEDHLCGVCRAWVCRGDDAWCGYCGAGVARLRVEVIPSVLEVGQISPMVCFAVTNASCVELDVESSAPLPEWLRLRLEHGLKVGAGETVRLWGEAGTFEIQQPTSAEVVLTTPAGEARTEVLVVAETPMLTISPQEIVFWSASGATRGSGATRTEVTISPDQGQLRILKVRPQLPRQLSVTGISAPQVASSKAPLRVEVGVDDERLLPQSWPPKLVVEYEGPHGIESVILEMPVIVKQPPQLSWEGANDGAVERFYSERQMVDVVLSNRDPGHRDGGGNNADLVVDSVRLMPPSGLAVKVDCRSDLPLRLAGGAMETVRFELDLSASMKLDEARDPEGRLVHFELEVRSNGGLLNRKMPLRLQPLRVFDGIVAIDFGSSNTCCAVVLPGDRPTFLKIDEDRAIAPTVVRYLDMAKNPPEIAMGAMVKDLAAQSDEVAASTVSRLKQRLGQVRESIDVRPRNSDEWVTRRASEAAADYLREIRRRAESQENAIFWDFILTHPARCPLRQYRRMEEALRQAFGYEGTRIEYMQEPIAALIPYFLEMAEQAVPMEYTVASFDIGGGTTDVAVVRVRQMCSENGDVEVVPEILFCEGVNFGGENLTDYLETSLRARCVAQLAREEPESELISDAIVAPAKADVLMNSAALRLAAEELKASLDQKDKVDEPYQLTLRVRRKDGRTGVYPFLFADLCVEGGSDLKAEFIAHVGQRVGELTSLLQPAKDKGIAIKTIQLSGKTSYFQEVVKTVQRAFADAEVTRPRDPKECVVRGACLERTMRTGRIRLRLPRSKHRMTSSIGIWPSRASAFQPILRADTEIPSQGLETSAPFAWDEQEVIHLWENIGGDAEDPASLYDRGLLTRLGSWQPVRSEGVHAAALRVGLKDLELTLALIEEDGAVIRCLPAQGGLR